MRKLNLADVAPIQDITNKIWSAFDILRGLMSTSDLNIVFFLLSLYKDESLQKTKECPIHEIKNSLRRELRDLDDYWNIYETYESIIEKIPNEKLFAIIKVFESINIKILKEHFSDIFDDLLYNLALSHGRGQGEFIQPAEITRLVLSLAELRDNSLVYNPFAGLASYGAFLNGNHTYIGQEINHDTWALGALRIIAHGKRKDSHFLREDSIENWINNERFDLIVSTPPFGMRLSNMSHERYGAIRNGEQYIIERGLDTLSKKGKVILVLPQGVLYREDIKYLRRKLVDSDVLETVISLPTGLLSNTGVGLSVLVINKGKQNDGLVKMVDAKDFVSSANPRDRRLNDYTLSSAISKNIENDSLRFVSTDKIRSLDYNLNVPWYFAKEYHGALLSEICQFLPGRMIDPDDKTKIVRIRDLKDDKVDDYLDVKSLEMGAPFRGVRAISESCILLAARWKTLKPTFFKFEGEPIHIRPDIIALKVDESKVDPQFLISEFYAEYVTEQLNSYRIGDIMPYIRRQDLMRIKIELPPLAEQRAKVKGLQELFQKIEILQQERNRLAHGYDIEKFNEFASLKHSLGAPRQNILSNSKTLISFFEKQRSDGFLKLNSEFEKQFDISLVDVFKEIRNDINHISVILEKGEDGLVVENYKLEVVSIDQIIRLIKSLSDKNYNFSFDRFFAVSKNIKKRGIVCNITLFKILLDNILSNASKYGFTAKSKTNVVVIDVIDEPDNLILNIKNNGEPFPKNFNQEKFIKKFSTTDKSSGTGIGGYDIDRIAKYFGDENWSLLLDDVVYPVWFVFSFPIISVE